MADSEWVTITEEDEWETIPAAKPIGFGEAATQDIQYKVPFVGPVIEGFDLANIALTHGRLKDPTTDWEAEAASRQRQAFMQTTAFGMPMGREVKITGEQARAADMEMLTNYIEKVVERQERGYTIPGQVGRGLSALPGWMIEFAATGGLYRTAATPIKRALRVAIKNRIASGITAWAVGSAARTAGMPQRIFSATMQRSLRDPDEGWATAIAKGMGSTYIEAASEAAGGKILRSLPFAGKYVRRLEEVWKSLKPSNTAALFAKRMLTKAGYSNLIGEMGEERLATVMHGLAGTEDFGATEGAGAIERITAGLSQDFEAKNIISEAITLAVPGAAQLGIGMLGGKAVPAAVEPAVEPVTEPTTSEQAIGQQYGLSNEEVDTRLAQAEGRFRELKQKETTKRTAKEAQELKFLKKKRTNIESLLEWDTTPREEAERPRQKPYKSQYVAGHEIPKILDMKDAERRKFMKKETGETSMAKMTPSMAQEYINALHKLAREKGIETGILPPERVFKKPIIGLTPQLYKAKILGVEFMTKPAAIGKQEFDLEFAKEAKQVDKMKRVINRLGGETVRTKTAARLKGKPTKSIVRFAELLNKYEEAPASLSKEEADVFNYYRNLNRSIIARENEVREELDMEPIPYRPGYMRHIVDVLAQDVMEGRHPVPEELKYWAEEHAAKKIRNPMEFQRKLGDELEEIFSNDLTKATKAMLWTGLREIHLDKPLKFFETQMGLHSEVIPDSTRRWAEKFINHMVVGKQTATDQRLNEMVKESGIGKVINKILRPFGRRVSHKPLTNLMGKAGRLQIYGVMGWRPKQLIRNKFQFLQNLALYTIKANIKSFLPASKQLKGLMSESLFLKTYKGFEDLTAIDKRTLGRLWLAPFQWTAVSNARRAMKVAYHDTMELIEDSKYKDLGWADSQRNYTEEKDFLYPSEKEKLLGEMEFGAGVTQYHYIPMAMPGAFKYKIATPLTRLQSWWMNYFFKFHRESAHRFFKGETREGLKLPWSRRVGWGRYLVIGGVVLNTLGYTSSYMFGAAPEGVPPLAQVLINMWKYVITDNERARATAERKFLYALKTFIPGYLALKDVGVMLDKDKGWEDLLFYKKGIFAEEETRPGIVRRKQRGPARQRR